MKHTKKIISILIGLVLLMFVPVGSSDQTDTFDITVTGEFLWIDITNATWAIGTVAMSSSTWTNETGITFIADMDNCTVTTDLNLQITDDGTDWTATTTGAVPGADTYRLNNSIDSWANENETLANLGTISTSIAPGNNESFDLRFDAPTSTSVSTEQSITVTATVVKS